MESPLIDHLFRHQYGKMVSVLTRIFGLSNLEMIEDAVQDTFASAVLKWRTQIPENPEAWLTLAAKNRAIDILRQVKAADNRIQHFQTGPRAMVLNDLFLDHEIEDSQLRMIFTACHPLLNPKDQMAFALKTVSGFNTREIASALLTKEESIKKRLSRARKDIQKHQITFDFPDKSDIPNRINQVLDVIYLIFNEGFHSGNKDKLVRDDLCGEAIRLIQILLKKESFRTGSAYALFGLMCLQAARLESKVSPDGAIINLKDQDRKKWYLPLVVLGSEAMTKASNYPEYSIYHIEAQIAFEHLKAKDFESTNWPEILAHNQTLQKHYPSPFTLLNIAVIHLQMQDFEAAKAILASFEPAALEQRAYLYYGAQADYFEKTGDRVAAILQYDKAIDLVKNKAERTYLLAKKAALQA